MKVTLFMAMSLNGLIARRDYVAGYVLGYGAAAGADHNLVDVGGATQWTLSAAGSMTTSPFPNAADRTASQRAATGRPAGHVCSPRAPLRPEPAIDSGGHPVNHLRCAVRLCLFPRHVR